MSGLIGRANDIPRDRDFVKKHTAKRPELLPPEMQLLVNQVHELQMEVDILKETIKVLKKDPGAERAALSNMEKAVITGALSKFYSLPELLKKAWSAKEQLLLLQKCHVQASEIHG